MSFFPKTIDNIDSNAGVFPGIFLYGTPMIDWFSILQYLLLPGLLKKRLRYKCFLVNFAKHLRTLTLLNTCEHLPPYFVVFTQTCKLLITHIG